MYLILALFLIVFEILYEGLAIKGLKTISGSIEFVYRAVVVIFLFGWITAIIKTPVPLDYTENFWKIIVGYLFVRFGIFDPAINLVMGQSINFIGTTKLWDKGLRWLLEKTKYKGKYVLPPEQFIFIRFILLVWGVCWLLAGNTDRI